ncbi:MAG: M81 family metallopeptidase, partial [Azospirillaceae bacterium]
MAGRRIAVVRVWQETNSFSQKPTTLADFRRSDWHEGVALTASLAGHADELTGFAAEIEAAGDRLVPVLAASCWPGGPAEPALIDALAEALERNLAVAGIFDGLLVSLHGAMSGERAPDVEGALLARLRRLLGDSVPLVLTLDHHANVTVAMISAVDALTAYRQCPHDDMVETGRRGARLLGAILDGRLEPAIAWRKIPLVTPAEGFMTAAEPLASWFALARRLEAEIGAGADISLFPVQPWLDVPEFGWSVTVVAPRERSEAAAAAARALAAHAGAERDRFYVA